MKKLVFALLLACCAFTQANAQFAKGSLMLGGNVGFSSTSVAGTSTTQIGFSPLVGYFFTPEFAAGAQIAFVSVSAGGQSESVFAFGPFLRYYFVNTDKTGVFGQGEFALASYSGGGSTNTGWGLGAGVDFFLNESVALEGILKYSSQSAGSGSESVGTFGLTFGVNAFLGREDSK